MFNKEEVKLSYYYTDIEPTLDRLNMILEIARNFENEGASRLMCALNMKHMDIQEVERLGVYIAQARDKMEIELVRVRKYEKDFNAEFATDHNGYYNSVSEMLKHIRSHMSPLKTIFRKFCNRNHQCRHPCTNNKVHQGQPHPHQVRRKHLHPARRKSRIVFI